MLNSESPVGKEIQITIRVEEELLTRADRLVAKLGNMVTRTALLRKAMEKGLAVVEKDYEAVPDPEPEARPSKRSKR